MKRFVFAVALITSSLGLTLDAADAGSLVDHQKLAVHYRQRSEKLLAEARKHEAMKAGYEKNPAYTSSKLKAGTIDHCQYYVDHFRENARKAEALAAGHEAMAKSGVK